MKHLTLALLISCSVITHIHAQEKRDSIKMLFIVMKQDTLITKTFDIMASSMKTQMQNMAETMKQNLGAKGGVNIDSIYSAMSDNIVKTLVKETRAAAKNLLDSDMFNIYDKHFTQQQINDFLAFYRSPSGQAMLNELTGIQKEVMDIMTKKYAPAIQEAYMKQFEGMFKDTKK